MSPIDETASTEIDEENLDSVTCDDESGLSDGKTLLNGTDCEIDGEIKCESSETISSITQAENGDAIGVEETASYELQLQEERENLSQHVICLGEYKLGDRVVNTNQSEAVNGEELKSQFQEEIHLNHRSCTAEGECDKHHEVVNETLEEEIQNMGVGTKPKGDFGVATANDDDFKPQFLEEIQPNHSNCSAEAECEEDLKLVKETSRETQLDEGVQEVEVEAMVIEDSKNLEDAVANGDDLKPQFPEEIQLNHSNCAAEAECDEDQKLVKETSRETQLDEGVQGVEVEAMVIEDCKKLDPKEIQINHGNCAEVVQGVEFKTEDCKNLEFTDGDDLIPQHHEMTGVSGETNLEEAKETAFLAKSTNYKGDEEVGEATDLDNDVSRELELNEAEKAETEHKIIKNDDTTGVVANGCYVVRNDLITW